MGKRGRRKLRDLGLRKQPGERKSDIAARKLVEIQDMNKDLDRVISG